MKTTTPEQKALNDCINALKIEPGKIALYYPVYINTFALAYILNSSDVKNVDTRMFDWSHVVPDQLFKELETHEKDVIFCFSSADKEVALRNELKRFIDTNHLHYDVSTPYNSGKIVSIEDISNDIDYSNFSLKYLFFKNKVNIRELYDLGMYERFFKIPKSNNPYLSKLLSALLARGYKTIYINTDITDESKGLLRKVLHEEFGFKFQLTPNVPLLKDNYVLEVETKGGQQAYEEVQLQNIAKKAGKVPEKRTFEIPDRIKYTSKTKLIAIYKNDKPSITYKEIAKDFRKISSGIFDIDLQKHLFMNKKDVAPKFVEKNIDFILQDITNLDGTFNSSKLDHLLKTNSFLVSLNTSIKIDKLKNLIKQCFDEKHVHINASKEEFIELIKTDANNLQIIDAHSFTTCLNDHHVTDLEDSSLLSHRDFLQNVKNQFMDFSRKLVAITAKKDQQLMINGLYLLLTIIINPNGFDRNELTNIEKTNALIDKETNKKLEFHQEVRKKAAKKVDKPEMIKYFNKLRIIAEDLTYLILEESLLCEPSVMIKIMDGFDISEFEYLFSITMVHEVYNQ